MNRRDLLKASAIAAGWHLTGAWAARRCFAAEPTQRPRRKPNFVFIFIDDLGWTDVNFMRPFAGLSRQGYYETPNIDRLAAGGVVFTNAYSNAPNCAPTRACLMSGQYGPRHGVYTVGTAERGPAKLRKLIPIPNKTYLEPRIVTIAEALKAAGYRCACIGKWHLGDRHPYRPADQGFDVVFHRSRRSHFTDDGQYLTDVLTDHALRFIEDNRHRPFFLYLSHHAVHTPLQAKPELIDKYKRKSPVGGHGNPVYAAMIESVDQSVARVLQKLDELALRNDTVVFFFSDNGGYANATSIEPLRGSKGMLYEGGIRVPLVIRWPGRASPGTVCHVPVIGIDFYPTMLEMAGLQRPGSGVLDGESLVDLLDPGSPRFAKRVAQLQNRPIYWHFPAYLEPYNASQWPWRTTPAGAVRQGDWKLIEFFEDGKIELYNLRQDISEKHNLAARLPDKAKQLHALLRRWREDVGAPVPTEVNPQFDPAARAMRKLRR